MECKLSSFFYNTADFGIWSSNNNQTDQIDQNQFQDDWNDQFTNQFEPNEAKIEQNQLNNNRYDQVADTSDPWDEQFGQSEQFGQIEQFGQFGQNTDSVNRYDEVPDEADFDNFEENFAKSKGSEKRYNVINEILTTEKDYLECLEIVRDFFISPLKSQKVLVEDEMEIIFINWNDLLLCTNRLYKSLKIRRKMTIKTDINIGDILCENVIIKTLIY